ncbi:MAG: hypothetical protein HN411_05205 [Waddliaceae bacterium]|jgi:hypothetical protein|nr:hypothetical protein [Waddliaceae bacterium]MBT3579145.1 hypothetical protein [Waddliaceae bacterium]MBT4444301.1 hypothetical protein [Waddliaceae bacterium]MBT6928516.1 hypothetical protein [Waddliaceae bacterium]MBT7264854.1 hypothetical protein [Waddliaceae bacterium]
MNEKAYNNESNVKSLEDPRNTHGASFRSIIDHYDDVSFKISSLEKKICEVKTIMNEKLNRLR